MSHVNVFLLLCIRVSYQCILITLLYLCLMSLFSYHPVSVSHVSVFLSSCIYVSCHCILTTLYLSLMSFYSYHSVSMFQVSVFLSPCNCLMSVYSYHPVSMSHVSAFLSPCIYVSCQSIFFRNFYSNLANSGTDSSCNTISREQIRFAEANISPTSQDIACPLSNPVMHIRILQNLPSSGTQKPNTAITHPIS